MLAHRLWQQVVQGAREAEAQPEELSLNSFYPQTESSGSRTCILPMKGTTIRSIESITRQKPYDTFFFKRIASGRKAKSQEAKVKQEFVSDRQLLTGAPPRV